MIIDKLFQNDKINITIIMMVKAHENCAFLRTVFWSFGYFCRKKTEKGWAVDCKSLHKSKKCLTSLMKILM